MKHLSQLKQRTPVVAASLALAMGLAAQPGLASIGSITTDDLSGKWQMTIVGHTGCGPTSMLVNVTLNREGKGTNAVIKAHGQCGNSTVTGQTFQILSLSPTGSGKANLSCGPACGWNLDIQVSPDRAMFNLVDVDPVNPGNYIQGVAIHQ